MPDNEVVRGFYDVFRRNIVSISARTLHSPTKSWSGTGCIIAMLLNPNYEPKAIVATAGHVLRPANQTPVEWTLRRDPGPKDDTRQTVFKTPHDNPYGPRFLFYNKDPRVDIGAIMADSRCTDGRPFLDWEEEGAYKTLVPAIQKGQLMDCGTRVAWAGFPASPAEEFGSPVLCYYEGVVSAVIDRADQSALYLLDGHNTWGVSGGPVWAWSDERHQVELIGIVVNYWRHLDVKVELPGHVTAVAIHPLMMYFGANYPASGYTAGYADKGTGQGEKA
ncbi:MAG: trypsin-like peptidase domain-containing protein [Planctomycetota bacterium]|nr:trypsin-like peptidase domain-containing protein [Planctomycetota bacterium]